MTSWAGAIEGTAEPRCRNTGPGLELDAGVGVGIGSGVTPGEPVGNGVEYGAPGATGTGENDGEGEGEGLGAWATSMRAAQL